MQQAAAPQVLCGQVHNGSCTTPVRQPRWLCAQHDNPSIRIIAASVADRPEILRDLSRTDARDFVAENPSCPQDTLQHLSHSTDVHVRSAVARNSNCPDELLLELCRDPEPRVRLGVTRQANIPQQIWDILAVDDDPAVRHEIVRRPDAPLGILLRLTSDRVSYIAWDARHHPAVSPAVLAMWQLVH